MISERTMGVTGAMETQAERDGFSILDLHVRAYDPEVTVSYFQDLNLLQIIDKLTARWGKKIKSYYRYLPGTPEEEAYRRAVYCDIKKDSVYAALMSFTEDLENVDKLRKEKKKVYNLKQRAVWQIRETESYITAYEKLEKELEQEELSSEGMTAFLQILKDIQGSEEYRRIREQTKAVLAKIKELRFIITYDKDRISVTLGELPEEGAYPEMRGSLQNPFIADPYLTELENACLDILTKKKADFFRELEGTAALCEAAKKTVLDRFEKEVLFYLSFRTLQLDMEKEGFCFSTPVTAEKNKMEAEGLYDLALALTSLSTGKKVIPNDFQYKEGDRFFVLTGPNQGGKTTFARSLGQLVYFSRIGLDVPARSAAVPFFPDIQTHFSVEESVETGRGKLKEELIRLAPMMEENRKGTFVIINELFTTAASYDATIMGKKVLEHFTALGCMGIYVTHLKELSEGIDGVVSMRAMLDDNRVQTFKIKRGVAEDIPCAENVVNKYRLTYEQLKERL